MVTKTPAARREDFNRYNPSNFWNRQAIHFRVPTSVSSLTVRSGTPSRKIRKCPKQTQITMQFVLPLSFRSVRELRHTDFTHAVWPSTQPGDQRSLNKTPSTTSVDCLSLTASNITNNGQYIVTYQLNRIIL